MFECQSLNSGSNVIDRIQFLIAESRKLTSGRELGDKAFIYFLEDQGIEGYKAKKRKRA